MIHTINEYQYKIDETATIASGDWFVHKINPNIYKAKRIDGACNDIETIRENNIIDNVIELVINHHTYVPIAFSIKIVASNNPTLIADGVPELKENDSIIIAVPKKENNLSDLERMKQLFDKIAVHYVIKTEEGSEFIYLYLTSEQEAKNNQLDSDVMPHLNLLRDYQKFGFENGELVSY